MLKRINVAARKKMCASTEMMFEDKKGSSNDWRAQFQISPKCFEFWWLVHSKITDTTVNKWSYLDNSTCTISELKTCLFNHMNPSSLLGFSSIKSYSSQNLLLNNSPNCSLYNMESINNEKFSPHLKSQITSNLSPNISPQNS